VRVSESFVVIAAEESEVKFRTRETPFEARLWAIAAPIPGKGLVEAVKRKGDYCLLMLL
jgi:hypothetical protein